MNRILTCPESLIGPAHYGVSMDGDPLAVVYPDNLAALGISRGLGAQGIPVTVLSSDRVSPGQYSCYTRRVACPTEKDEERFLAFLINFGQSQPQAPVLFLTTDSSIVTVHRHRELLEQWYRFPMAPWPVLRQVMLKDQLYNALEGVVPIPRTGVPSNEAELAEVARDVGYPALVKPQLRCLADTADPSQPPFDKLFGSKAIRVNSLKELEHAYHAIVTCGFQPIVQEEIAGPPSSLYSIGLCATRQGEVVATFTSQKLAQVPPDFGDGLVVKAIRAPELIPLGERVVHHFGYYGLADIEFKWDARARVYKLLDFNPRSWPWINLPTVCGVNLSYVAYLDAVDRPIDRTAFVQQDFQTRWVSARGLLVYIIRSFQAGQSWRGLWALLRQFERPRVGPLLSTDDVLWRMFCSPAFWLESLQEIARGLKQLQTLR